MPAANLCSRHPSFSVIITGLGIRQLFHVNPIRKLAGLIALCIQILITIAINLALGQNAG